jgi:DNA gyrase subunit A
MSEGTQPAEVPQDRIRDLNIERELQDSYLTYAMSTIMDRALPDVRDGLKPSQRRILVAMNDLNLTPGRKHIKCAKIAGDTSGNYHPHGEAVIYPTLVRMAQDWNMRHPLIDPQGNFGSNDNDPPAAMRYTEARMTAVMVDMMADLDLDTVDFVPNYDERLTEPTVLPGKFPNLLVNGSTGIAVGMACNLLPHNLGEICDAVVHVINNPACELPELLQIVPGPDFPTGGVIRGRDGIIDGYKTGRGRMQLQARVEIEEEKSRSRLVVTEMAYGGIRENLVNEVVEAHKNGNMPDVSGVNDESGRLHKCRIVIDLKRDADAEIVKRQLFQFTSAQVTVSMINIALVNKQPRTMGLKELIYHFIEHRKVVITRRTKFLLRKAQQRAHILEGQILAVCDIDEVVRLIRTSKTREEAMDKLRAKAFRIAAGHPLAPQIPARLLERPGLADRGLFLSQAQAEAIAALRLIQLVGLEIERLAGDYRQVVEEIEGYERILADPELVLDIIREDTLEMKEKYANPRRTSIEGDASAYNYESLITPHDVVVTLTHKGYIKRLPADTYKSQGRGGRGIKGGETREEDFVEHLFVANTHDHLLFFTDTGRVYAQRVFDVPELARTSLGRSVANLCEFQPGEKIAQVLAIKDFSKDESFLVFATAQGTVKKTALSAYANINKRGIIAIGLEEGDKLIEVALSTGKDHIMLATKSGLAVRFEEENVRAMGRPAGGVTGVKFKRSGDAVVSMIVIPAGNNVGHVLTACVKGYGKRTPLQDYPVKGRATQGVINIDANDRNGDVVGIKLVSDTDELMMITEKGILIRTRIKEIRETGRSAVGVRLLSLDSGDKLVAMAQVAIDDTATGPDGTGTGTGTAADATPPGDEPDSSTDDAGSDPATSGPDA